jgi:hypothetical protein
MVTADGRQLIAERGLTVAAVEALIPMMSGVGFEELGLVKALLKRFFSAGPWTAMDAAALAAAVGGPRAEVAVEVQVTRHDLDGDLTLVAGWVDETFLIDVEVRSEAVADEKPKGPSLDLSRTFSSGVVPQPTPNPRTLRFATARRAMAQSESFRRENRFDDERVAVIFAVADDVVDVLVGADFVAVSLVRPDRWPALLEPVLDVVASTFGGDASDAGGTDEVGRPDVDVRGVASSGARATTKDRHRSRLDRAWADLGTLHANKPADLELVLAAAHDADSARRQVAAQLLSDAPDVVAAASWSELLGDPSRSVRRAAVDAVVGAERETLRPLLERATTDADAWIRWKSLHGLAVLGVGPSLAAIGRLDEDPDFRVRLEAANARNG